MFQEAIARNLPFCDDFYIITNEKYRYIVEGQVQAFQGLSYQLFLEEMGRQSVQILTDVLEKSAPTRHLRLEASLRPGASVKQI